MIRPWPTCGANNRVPAKHLSDAGDFRQPVPMGHRIDGRHAVAWAVGTNSGYSSRSCCCGSKSDRSRNARAEPFRPRLWRMRRTCS